MRWTILPVAALTFLAAACHSGGATSSNKSASSGNDSQVAASSSEAAPSVLADDAASAASFQLTDDFIAKFEAYEEEAAKNPCALSPMMLMKGNNAENRSLDQTAAAFDAQPGVHDALQRHGLTAREMILGMVSLLGAATQDMAQQHPDMVKDGEITMNGTISPANMAVYHRHKDELHRHQAQLGREQLKATGGKLPPCLVGE